MKHVKHAMLSSGGIEGKFGLYEAIDIHLQGYPAVRQSGHPSFMAHHQGMSCYHLRMYAQPAYAAAL